MKIGALSLRTGVSVRMLRYYEQLGLLDPDRSESGYRHYRAEAVRRVEDIVSLNRAGLPLAAISDLLGCVPVDTAPVCEVLRARIGERLAQIDRQLESLQHSQRRLMALLR